MKDIKFRGGPRGDEAKAVTLRRDYGPRPPERARPFEESKGGPEVTKIHRVSRASWMSQTIPSHYFGSQWSQSVPEHSERFLAIYMRFLRFPWPRELLSDL